VAWFVYKLKFVKQIKSIHLGNSPTGDRTNQTVKYEHIYLSVFISITICSGIGLIISISLFVFNIRFRSHR
jgi:hypothetical protein